MNIQIQSTTVKLIQGDITEQDTDAIVNAANSELAHGGGVARAIADKAGKELQEESRAAAHVPTGQVVSTTGGNLKAKYVIHSVGPIWRGGDQNEQQLLHNAIENSLKEADRLGLSSISFPAISTGIFGYPLKNAADTILRTIVSYCREEDTELELIQLVLFSTEDYQVFESVERDIEYD